jgi:hypothetical protein
VHPQGPAGWYCADDYWIRCTCTEVPRK